MPVQQLLAWAIHLYARQERRKKGEDIEVLAFYAIDKRRRQLLSSDDAEPPSQQAPTDNVGRQKAKRPAAEKRTRPGIRADVSIEEETSPAPVLEKNIVFEEGSPGSVGMYWKDRISFLKSLCKSTEYQRLVCWLQERQVSRKSRRTLQVV